MSWCFIAESRHEILRTVVSKGGELGFQNANAVGGDEILVVSDVVVSDEFAEGDDLILSSMITRYQRSP